MKIRWISLTVLLALALTGCGQGGAVAPLEPQVPTSNEPVEVPPLATATLELPDQGDTAPMLNLSDPAIQKIIGIAADYLAKRFSISSDQIQFKEAMELVWPDSSLGCPNLSSMYTQVLTPGYLIRLQTLERIFEYHTDKNSLVIYCENPSPLPLDTLPK